MRRRTLYLGLAALALWGLTQGCTTGIEHLPVNPFLALDENRGLDRDGTVQATPLALDALQPPSARIGEYVVVRGQGRLFPEGYARFTFSGNAAAEVFLPRAVGEIRVRVPAGTISGPLGFLISPKSLSDDLGGGHFPSGEETPAFTIPYPGLRILGPADPPGGPANSPYPQGPPAF